MTEYTHNGLHINDAEQMIQGVQIEDTEVYEAIRGVVEAQNIEEWIPTAENIKELTNEWYHPDPEDMAFIKKVLGENNER